MRKTLTDLSQLSRAMLKTAPNVDEAKPEPLCVQSQGDAEDVLAYFSRSSPPMKAANASAESTQNEVAALRVQLREAKTAQIEAEAKLAACERERKVTDAALARLQRENDHLQGECGRMRGELRKLADVNAESKGQEKERASPPVQHVKGVLAAPAGFDEVFAGEVREMVLAALSEARDAARRGTKERRAAVLDAVLASNPLSGELERRRASLRQTLKDCGYYTDPKALEKLGFKLISGRNHWKIEYANVRMPMAKTPSDFRANINMATDMANRCF